MLERYFSVNDVVIKFSIYNLSKKEAIYVGLLAAMTD